MPETFVLPLHHRSIFESVHLGLFGCVVKAFFYLSTKSFRVGRRRLSLLLTSLRCGSTFLSQMQESNPNILKRLYNWTISWAEKPQGLWALAVLSFAESSFFPIPPDVLLIPLVFGAPKKWWRIALICTLASTVGGVFGWYIGHAAWDATQSFFFNYVPGFTHENFDFVRQSYQSNAFLAIFGAALTPIPYKIFTIAAGVCDVSIATLIAASLLGRGGRFFAVALIIYFVGPKAKEFIDKYFNILASAFFVLLVLGFVLVKFMMK